MKRGILLSSISLICCLSAYAYAEMFDRYINELINIDAICGVVLITHVICFLVFKYSRKEWVRRLKIRICKFAIFLSSGKWLSILAGYILPIAAFGIYIYCICLQVYILTSVLLLIIWICYWILVLRSRLRNKFLSGKKVFARLTAICLFQISGLIVYFIICESDLFHMVAHYTDTGTGFDGAALTIYPGREGLYIVIFEIIEFAILFAMPVVLLVALEVFKAVRSRLGKFIRFN